jgi:hypothetical protein
MKADPMAICTLSPGVHPLPSEMGRLKELVQEWGMPIQRACSNLLLDTSTFHYCSRRPDQAALKERIKDICETRVWYRYRRVHVMLRREEWFVNQKKVRRLYNELGPQLRNKHPKRKVRAKLIRDRKRLYRHGKAGRWNEADQKSVEDRFPAECSCPARDRS